MSESSKKAGKSICSPGGLTSCTISSTGKHKEGHVEADTYSYDVDGSYNSLYSFLKTEASDDSMRSSVNNDHSPHMDMMWEKAEDVSMEAERHWPLRKEPPWLEDIKVTPELVFRYQISETRELDEILKIDLEALDRLHQPCMVNEQLSQLYLDLEGLSKHLTLEEGILSSSGSSGEDNVTSASSHKSKQKKKKFLGYDRMAMIFEESAPLPPPENTSCT